MSTEGRGSWKLSHWKLSRGEKAWSGLKLTVSSQFLLGTVSSILMVLSVSLLTFILLLEASLEGSF